jgi:site-specific recombinase XerD
MSGGNGNNNSIAGSIEAFLRLAGARSEHTARTYRAALGHFLAFLATQEITPDCAVADLTLDHARDFAAWLCQYRDEHDQPLRENSLALYLIALGRFLRYLIVGKRLPAVDMADYEALRDDLRTVASRQAEPLEKRLPEQAIVDALVEEARRPPTLSDEMPEGRRRRLTLAWRRDLAIVLALQSSGMRVGELVALRRGDLEHAKHGAYVAGKGKKKRFVRFSGETWAALTAYLRERSDGEAGAGLASYPLFCRHDRRAGDRRLAMTTRSVRRIVEGLADRAGIAERFHMTPHKLRHYFATRFLRETGDLALTQDALGHSSPATTRVYAQTSQGALIAAHKKIFDRPSLPRQHTLPGLGVAEEEEAEP